MTCFWVFTGFRLSRCVLWRCVSSRTWRTWEPSPNSLGCSCCTLVEMEDVVLRLRFALWNSVKASRMNCVQSEAASFAIIVMSSCCGGKWQKYSCSRAGVALLSLWSKQLPNRWFRWRGNCIKKFCIPHIKMFAQYRWVEIACTREVLLDVLTEWLASEIYVALGINGAFNGVNNVSRVTSKVHE